MNDPWARWWRIHGAAELRDLVMRVWDPIGVAVFEDAAADEYDNYLPTIGRLLEEAATPDELAQHLSGIRTGTMGLGSHGEADRRAAIAIREWYDSPSCRQARADA